MPKYVDHDERRRELARAAHRVAGEGGLDALTVRAIAKEAGYSTGVLAHYFTNRDDLLLAAFREVYQGAITRAQAQTDAGLDSDPVNALLEALFEALPLDDERRADTTVWFAFLGLAAGNPELRREGAERYRLWREFLEAAVTAASADPITPAEAQRIARYLAALVAGLGVQALFDPDGIPAGELRRELRRALSLELGVVDLRDGDGAA
jgi:AcrR family transcriptional regulator